MKRRFTILTAALALLVSLAIPMGMWGQSTVTFDATTDITANASSYQTTELTINAADGSTWTANGYGATANTNIIIGKGGANYLRTPVIDGTITSVAVTWSGNTNYYLALQTTTGTELEAKSNPSTSTTETFNVSGSYNQLQLVGRRSSGTSNAAATITMVVVTYTTGGTPTPSMSVSPNSINFGSNNTINPANPYSQTFNVTFENLTQALSVSVGSGLTGVSVSPTSIAANATSPQTVTVSYNPTTAGSISGNISVNSSEVTEQLVTVTGSAVDPSNVVAFERYTGTLVEGDYIICANEEVAMKNVISSNRFANEAVTVTSGKITNPDASIIWHIAPDGDYYTMYNAAVGKYAAGTTSNNQGTLLDVVTDYARWQITYQYSNYTVICYGRNSSNNKYLRRNGTYGWATYSNSTGNVPTFYKKVVTNQVAMPTFSLPAGTYYETKSVELSCETTGATIYYTTDGTTPSASNGTEYTTAISVSTTTTIKAIAIKSGMADSDVATAEYIIELPLSTMDQIFARATEIGNTATDVRIDFNNWVVTAANNSSHTFVSDGTKGFMIYQSNHGFAAGDILSGIVECKLQLFNGAAEITNLTSTTTGLTVTTGGAVTVANIAMSNLAAINTGALVSYQNLTCSISTSGNYTNYYLSDGTTQIQAYSTLYSDLANSLEDGKIYNITGVFVQNNSTKRVNPRSAADIVEVQVQHNEYTLTVGNLVHVTTYVFDASDQSEALLIGAGQVDIYDGTEVMISLDVEEGYVIESLIVGGVDVTSQIDADAYTFTMPTNAVTVTATAVEYVAPTPGNYVRINSLDQLTDGSKVIIAARHNATADSYYAMQNATSGKPEGTLFTSVTSGNDEAVASTITDDEDNYYWMVNVTENGYTFTNASNHMIGYSSSTNFATGGDNIEWTIESAEAGNNAMVPGYEGFVIKNHSHSDRAFAFNGSVFGAYSTNNMNAAGYNFFLDFFVQTSAPITETYTLEIEGYGDTQNPGGWYLIASPIGNVAPTNVAIEGIDNANMVSGTFDLFYFDHTKDNEWVNYKDNTSGEGNASTDPGFNLISGKGYLYANSEDVTLVFTGTAPTDEEVEVTLDYEASAEMPGWNLVGNPFAVPAYFSTERDFYTMNSTGTSFELCTDEERSIEPMQGVFVIVGSNEGSLSFTTSNPNTQGKGIVLKLKGRSNTDAAIVRFGEGRTLPKLQLFEGSTKIYIPQDGKEYAVVRSEEMGAMPVNFKAEENGTYSLNVGGQNTEFAYLHLIDNMTGADVDLLQTPSYSFEAKTTDYESRFKLVFATGDNSNDDNFAFYSNGSFVINNEGNAELQVIDIMGRIVKSESINGCANVSVNGAAGVYMLRLVNGDNVKVQKVVVK